MSVEIEGVESLIEHFDKLEDLDGMKGAVKKACALVERAARQKAPKDSGALRRSIESDVDVGTNEITGTVFTALEYAPYVEFGTGLFAEKGGRKDVPWRYESDDGNWYTTSGQHPQPFMRPALNENREAISRILKEGIK